MGDTSQEMADHRGHYIINPPRNHRITAQVSEWPWCHQTIDVNSILSAWTLDILTSVNCDAQLQMPFPDLKVHNLFPA